MSTSTITLTRSPGSVVRRFVIKRNRKFGIIWGVAFSVLTATSALGFVSAFATPQARAQLAASFGSNVGLKVLLGAPHRLETAAGFTAWRSLGTITIIGSIWALLTATKVLRGEEENGRWELFLGGQTTAKRATLNTTLGLYGILGIIYLFVTTFTIIIGRSKNINFAIGSSIYYGLCVVASAAIFIAIGTLTSQLAATRRQAAAIAAGLFGIFFLMRALADSSAGIHWLVYATPLGWIEMLRPLTGPQPLWLLPIATLIIAAIGWAVLVAGWRDLGASIIADRESAKPRYRLLGSPLGTAIRMTRGSIIGWAIGIGVGALLFGSVAKSASQALSSSSTASSVVTSITGKAEAASIFLGIIFFMMMTFMMVQVTGAVGAIRDDEAQGYLDNFLVGPVSRRRWFGGRVGIVASTLLLLAATVSIATWVGTASQHTGVSYSTLLTAGINATAPAILLAGIGLFIFGIKPRLTTTIMYGLLAWSFLMEMVGSVIKLNHFILDTSLLHHVPLAPARDVDWAIWGIYVSIGVGLAILGSLLFNRRDIQNE